MLSGLPYSKHCTLSTGRSLSCLPRMTALVFSVSTCGTQFSSTRWRQEDARHSSIGRYRKMTLNSTFARSATSFIQSTRGWYSHRLPSCLMGKTPHSGKERMVGKVYTPGFSFFSFSRTTPLPLGSHSPPQGQCSSGKSTTGVLLFLITPSRKECPEPSTPAKNMITGRVRFLPTSASPKSCNAIPAPSRGIDRATRPRLHTDLAMAAVREVEGSIEEA
mmetsp:Transcript_51488/g.115834  ORF Transcript_51488/g.115834 Transcript_51488/m.115834 type:complete len:219 (+) Transcript_51488:331-987(+)